MTVDPSKISLKGFFLDPNSSSVGGTRNIYNNGVMCAKIYLGFSYQAPAGDTSTVQDIIDWINANASIRASASNKTDAGIPSDFGWPYYASTDPNQNAYVYDVNVVVPDSNEDTNQQPGNNLWHTAYYFKPTEGNLTPVNVYITFSYVDSAGTEKTVSTINFELTTLACSEWAYSTEDFSVIWNPEAIDTQGVQVAQFSYQKSTSDPAFNQIHRVLRWTTDEDGFFEVSPRTDKSLSENECTANLNLAFCLSEYCKLFCIGSHYDSDGGATVTFLVDKTVANSPIYEPGYYNILSERVPFPKGAYYGDAATIVLLDDTKGISADDLLQFDGEALIMWQRGSIQFMANNQVYSNCSVYNTEIEKGRYIIDVKCVDSFGQKLSAKIDLGTESELYPENWAVWSVSKL